jgi:hypothetical protein
MTDVDQQEVISRAVRWCAEAGRQVTEDQARAALEPLSWDEMIAVRALLADPPPARPLGPHALADIARGASPEMAAQRERDGRYLAEAAFESVAQTPPSSSPPPARSTQRRKASRADVRVRRARDRVPHQVASVPPPLPLLEELYRPEGRAILERLIRQLGTRRSALAMALGASWRRADGAPVSEGDVAALLDEHGLARPFERRERALLLHALKAAGGARPRAAAQIGISAEAFCSALERLGAVQEAEEVRDEWRADIRRRATLSERVHLLTADEERLADLGVLDEVLADLRIRLPEHLKALRAAEAEALAPALGRSLSLSRPAIEALARRFALDLGASAPRAGARARGSAPARPRTRAAQTGDHQRGRRRP